MHAGSRFLVVSTLLVALLCVQPLSAMAFPAPSPARSPPTEKAVPWVDDLLRVVEPTWFYKALGKIIEWRTNKPAAESQHIAERVGCLVAKGATSPEHIYTALNYAEPVVPISLEDAKAISSAIAEYKASHPDLFDVAKWILKRMCA